jgi:ACS family D-galactonate transporter-like MFS transporter
VAERDGGGMITGMTVFGAAFTTDPIWAILWISISLGGLSAAAPAAWALPSLVAPRGGTGTIGGIMNFANASIGGIAAPIVTGFIVAANNSFKYAFIVSGVVLTIGVLSYLVVLGRIEPLPDLAEPGAASPTAPLGMAGDGPQASRPVAGRPDLVRLAGGGRPPE